MQRTVSFIAVLVVGIVLGFLLGYMWTKSALPQLPLPASVQSQHLDTLGQGLLLYADFENNANDQSGNRCHGTLMGTPRWTKGVHGRALEMSERSSWVEFPRSMLNPRTSPWSVSIWVSMQPAATYRESLILSVANAQGSGYAGALWYQICGAGERLPGELNFAMRSDAQASQTECVPAFRFNDGKWHHIAAVRRTVNEIEFWIDGALAQSTRNDALNDVNVEARCRDGNVLDTNAPAYLGYSPAYNGYWFNGRMDELRVYSRAISPEEIAMLAAQ